MVKTGVATCLVGLFLAVSVNGCSDTSSPPPLDLKVSGTVTNHTSAQGPIFVEIEHNLRSVADSKGNWTILVHRDFYVDSLYAWVDSLRDNAYTPGEEFGFLHSDTDSLHVLSFQVRDYDVTGLHVDIR